MAVDLHQRDPNGINDHIKVEFADILAEPDGVHSLDCVWTCSQQAFTCTTSCCYKTITFFCGICLSIAWGFEFAALAFNHVWIYTPCMRDFTILCGCYQRCCGAIFNCLLTPGCEACGTLFSKITVRKL